MKNIDQPQYVATASPIRFHCTLPPTAFLIFRSFLLALLAGEAVVFLDRCQQPALHTRELS